MRLVTLFVSLGLLAVLGGVAGVAFIPFYFGHDLPDYSALSKYDPSIVTRAYAATAVCWRNLRMRNAFSCRSIPCLSWW